MTRKRDIEKQLINKVLTFKLTTQEIADKGKAASAAREKLIEKEAEFETIKTKYKGQIGSISMEISENLKTIRRGTEDRNVECTMIKDYERHVVEFVYNGEVMEERPMTMDERQPELLPVSRRPQAEEALAHP